VCCTSANAVNVVNSLDAKKIIFTPDKNLAMYVARFTDKEIIPYDGFCPTHHLINAGSIERAKEEHPNAKVVVHPECLPDVIDLADHVCSTSGMYKYVEESDADEFVVGTEVGILYRMRKQNPGKTFHPSNKFILRGSRSTACWRLADAAESAGAIRAKPHRLAPHRRRAHRAFQLAVRPPQ
jgi:quinolinate synthase